MPKTKRERIIVAVTIVVAFCAFAYTRLEDSGALGAFRDGPAGGLPALVDQYREYEDILGREEKILSEFARIEEPYRRTPGLSPEKDFQLSVENICRKHNFMPQILPPEMERLKNVEDWGLVLLPVQQMRGSYLDAANLLKEIDASGYLIEDLMIRQDRQDFEEVVVELIVARPVKLKDVPALNPGAR